MTRYTYDPDSDVLTTTVSDATGQDPPRTTIDTYNPAGELASVTDPLGNAASYTYDGLGDKLTQTNPAGVTTAYIYDAAGDLLTTTLKGYTGNPSSPIAPENLVEESRAYDPAGRLASVTNVMGTTTDYTYYGNDELASSYVVDPSSPTGMDNLTTYGYDAAGNPITETSPGGLVTKVGYNADSQATMQTEDPAGADRVTTASYDPAGDMVSDSLTAGGVTQTVTTTYDQTGNELSQTVDNPGGGAGSTALTTSFVRDERGLVVTETDPNGNITNIENDEAGRPVVQISPAVQTESNAGAPITARPITMTGYDTFGDPVETSDPDGNVTKVAYDLDGRVTSTTEPSYTPPGAHAPVGGTDLMAYNSLGEEISGTDPLGNVTSMGFDQLGDLTSQTDPDGGTWTYTYDPASEQSSVTDPTGAQTQATYNNLGQEITSTDLVRQNASAAYTTRYGYDAAGNQTSQTSPTGVTASSIYDPLGELTSSTDGAGNITSFSYNLDGDPAKITAPDGSSVVATYDLAGRQLAQSDLSASGTVLRTESAGYDADGNVTSSTDFLGNVSKATYNAIGLLTSQTQPVSATKNITESYEYDLDGHPTEVIDGNGDPTYATYNPLGLPESVIEPPAGGNTSGPDSTTTEAYDANGDLVTQDRPGGVQTTDTYDAMGNLTAQSGTGASAPTASRAFTYDKAGRMLTASTAAAGTAGTPGSQPATSESFSYDDRGLLLAAAGSAGDSTFTYNASGQISSDTDAAGTSSYTYDSAGRLATDADAASGTTGAYSYNSLGQVTQISYGTGNNTQSFGYDPLHRLASDTIATAGGAQVAAISYGYNADDDVTSMTTSGLATAGGGTGTVANTYGYDEANRLTSAAATPAGGSPATSTYGYDGNGNLINDNGVTYTYDARNELVSDSSGNSYTYAADGDLVEKDGASATTTASSDAYGQQITEGASSYSWDALDRMVSATGQGNNGEPIDLTYDGMTDEVSSDSGASYSRDPGGAIVGVDVIGGGKTLALNDSHDDLSGTFAAAGTALAGSTTYDPWGQVIATSGPAIQIGYQGQWTDPGTAQVDMGSRFYGPAQGGFGNQDTFTTGGNGSAVSDDLHAYADDNPLSVTDLSGHSPSGKASAATITQSEVQAAAAKAAQAKQVASRDEAQARSAESAATHAESTASAAVAKANRLNNEAKHLFAEASQAQELANHDFQRVQADQAAVQSIEGRIQMEVLLAVSLDFIPGLGEVADAAELLVLAGLDIALNDAKSKEAADKAVAQREQREATRLENEADNTEELAFEANMAALFDGLAAKEAASKAKRLAQVAAAAANIAAADEAFYQQILKEFESQAKKAANTCDLVCKAKKEAKRVVKTVVTTVVGKAIGAIAGAAGAAAGAAGGAAGAVGGAVAGGAAAAGGAIVGAVGAIADAAGPILGDADPPGGSPPPLEQPSSRLIKLVTGSLIGGLSNLVDDAVHGVHGWVLLRDTAVGLATGPLFGAFDGAAAVVGGSAAGFSNNLILQILNEKTPDSVSGWQLLIATGIGGLGNLAVLGAAAHFDEFVQNEIAMVLGFATSICDPNAAFGGRSPC